MYTFTWKKYLPVIRLLLKKSGSGDQSMSLNRTDFEKTSRLRKPSCTFSVEIVKGRLRPSSPPLAARELHEVLLQDAASEEMLRRRNFGIALNADFQLSIKDLTPAEGQGESA